MERRRGNELVARLERAKAACLDHAKLIDLHSESLPKTDPCPITGRTAGRLRSTAARLVRCSDTLTVKDYFTLGEVQYETLRCRQHLLCPVCAIARGARMMSATLERFAAIRRHGHEAKLYLLTLTLRNGDDLGDLVDLLIRSWSTMWHDRKPRGRHAGNELARILGGLRSVEVKRGRSGGWHPHLHALVLADHDLPVEQDAGGAWRWPELSRQWAKRTNGSFVVECHPVTMIASAEPNDGASLTQHVTTATSIEHFTGAVAEVCKYAVKLARLDPADLLTAWGVLHGRRLAEPFGLLRGLDRDAERAERESADLVRSVAAVAEVDYRYGRSGYTATGYRLVPESIPF
jgi:hypothetical protein